MYLSISENEKLIFGVQLLPRPAQAPEVVMRLIAVTRKLPDYLMSDDGL